MTPEPKASFGPGPRNRHFLALDLALVTLAPLLALSLRFEGLDWVSIYPRMAVWYLTLTVPLKIFLFVRAGLYKHLWRYAGVHAVERILKATALSGLLAFGIGAAVIPALGLAPTRVPLSVLLLDALLTTAFVALPRLAARLASERRSRERRDDARRVLIAGAGAAGAMIVKELLANPELGLRPVGFLDDDPAKLGNSIGDVPVLDSLSALAASAARYRVDRVIIAMPRAPGLVIRKLVAAATEAGIEIRTMPGLFDIISGRAEVNTLRRVEIQDLLRRAPVTTDLEAVRKVVTGQTVLVTGAGGSIGAELCRQLTQFAPRRIVLLGQGENSIFDILQELDGRSREVQCIPVIADVRDRDRLARVFEAFDPVAVFHAAAHKHVPMMECNVAEAITNNVLGTQNVVALAAQGGVECLVLVSTDKAVRPTSVMGATKRVAEQIVQLAGEQLGRRFMAVRFGNVLGSRGSVVPTFMRQIAGGGPVTVTHPEMRRYFMTIPEAVQLVLQAGALGRDGEVFVLDMGEPVKITDLAADLIRLSGKEVEHDIKIEFSGIRPGEKLYEELFVGSEHATPTRHQMVLRARNSQPTDGAAEAITRLVWSAQHGRPDEELRGLLARLVPDFTRSATVETGAPATGRQSPATAVSEARR